MHEAYINEQKSINCKQNKYCELIYNYKENAL